MHTSICFRTVVPSASLLSIYCAPKATTLTEARPALGGCPAGQSPPGDARLCRFGGKPRHSPSRVLLALAEPWQSLSLKARTAYQGAISCSPRTSARLCGLRAPAPSATRIPAAPPEKQPPSRSPARPRGLTGGAEPARLRQPMPGWGKPRRSPRPGAPGFGGTLAILMTS